MQQNLIDAHEKNLSERETELERLNEQLAELDKQCESSKDTISTMKGKVNEMKKELEDKHEVEMQQKVSSLFSFLPLRIFIPLPHLLPRINL